MADPSGSSRPMPPRVTTARRSLFGGSSSSAADRQGESQGWTSGNRSGSRRRGRRLRWRYLVNRQVQLRYIGFVVGLEALALTTIAWAIFVVVWQPFLNNLRWSDLGPNPREVFAASVREVTITTLGLLVLFGVACATVGLLVSHGVAGPLVRLKRVVRAAAEEGAYETRVTLRRGDCLLDLADDINALLSRLEERQREQRELLERVAEAVGAVSHALERGEAVTEEVLQETQELEGLLTRASARP